MLAGMTSRQLTEWMAFAALEPFGDERADLRMGILASVIANVNRDPKRRAQPYEPKDFLPRFEEEEPEENQAKMLQKVEMLNVLFGGRDLRPDSSEVDA